MKKVQELLQEPQSTKSGLVRCTIVMLRKYKTTLTIVYLSENASELPIETKMFQYYYHNI